MSKPFTFGVELEFNLSYVAESVAPSGEMKTVVFHTLEDEGTVDQPYRIISHIGNTIAAAGGFKIDSSNLRGGNIENWEITTDPSIGPCDTTDLLVEADAEVLSHQIEHDDGSHSSRSSLDSIVDSEEEKDDVDYKHCGVEVVSPALVFGEDSLQQIKKMCTLLTSTYRINVNNTCGLHIHLGHHRRGFRFGDLKKLLVFLYTFEPQINSIHPQHRQNNPYCETMRKQSSFAYEFRSKYNCFPTSSDFASAVFACKQRSTWVWLARNVRNSKYSQYNIVGVMKDAAKNGSEGFSQTIEFRQHEGTLDGTRITQWIKTIVGIVQYVETCSPLDFVSLMTTIWKAEKSEKMGSRSDSSRVVNSSPTLANEGFTIVDLLKHIGLPEQAEYYKDKWHKHTIRYGFDYRESDTTWDFESSGLDHSSDEYKEYKKLAEKFNGLRLINKAERQAGLPLTSFDFSVFPPHHVDRDHESESERESDDDI